ncbi:MAG TPA: hypothetical protein VFA89_15965 [Terriglobales bacterium]|nr:hypothetical protein [Terriglobales bacterium]
MQRLKLVLAFVVSVMFALGAQALHAQEAASTAGVPVKMVVTAEARHGSTPPPVTQDDVMVYQGKNRDKVTGWAPAQGDNAQLEFFVLLDDSSGPSLGVQLDDVRAFINSQPPTTKVGIAYMQNGIARVEQQPTADHTAAAKALRLPIGIPGINASPYFSLSDLVKKWPQSNARREVLMISDGIDRYYGVADLQDPYVSEAIQQAQKAGIIVFAIYNPGAGHYGHSYWRSYYGQMLLSQVADQTGGESYYIGFNAPAVAFAPFLDNVQHHLANQYLLTFVAQAEKKSGLQPVKLNTELTNVDLLSADHVYVPAGQ